ILLAPRNPDYYQSFVRMLERRRDGDGLRKLLSALERTELDVSDHAKRERERESGAKDLSIREDAAGTLSMAEAILPWARAKGGATSAVGAWQAIQARVGSAIMGVSTDLDALVFLAEEAAARSPSGASRYSLVSALLFRATDRLARDDSRFAAIRPAPYPSPSSHAPPPAPPSS